MVGSMNGADVKNAYEAYTSKAQSSDKSKKAKMPGGVEESKEYGKTIGEPELSEKASKYYEQLKKKFGNYDFILVSKDQMANAKANAGRYANAYKPVVLIDEEKIEKMATDEAYRKKYEDILSGAADQLKQMASSMGAGASNVKGFGVQINDDGTASYFAVLKKSSIEQKVRIEKHIQQKRAEKKENEKKAAKKEQEERIRGKKEELVTFSADSIEELMKKIDDFNMEERTNAVQTQEEKLVGQTIDFRG